MCGIAGILKVHPLGAEIPPPDIAIPKSWLDILDESIKHRGPDGAGRFRDRARRVDGSVVDVALVHRRLAIIDPACGHQPMVSERGKDGEGLVAVVFNGCIYNHRELRRELEAAGNVFKTDHSDTEVLIHGWREWGLGESQSNDWMPLLTDGLFARIQDMFAAAIWDRRHATLTLARDRFGQKPLYLAKLGEGAWGFSSTVPGLLRLTASTPAVDQLTLSAWIRFGFQRHPPTEPLQAVPESTVVHLDGAEPITYWVETAEFWGDFFVGPWGEVGWPRGAEPTAAQIDEALHESVSQRLQADVPLGCFLSGGVDSSLIAAIARREHASLQTFAVRMPVSDFDESPFAQCVADHLGTHHNTLDCDANPAGDLVHQLELLGLPFGDSSLLPTCWVSRATREHVRVAISGDGGDELFAGYQRYVAVRAFRFRHVLSTLPVRADENPISRRTLLARLADASRHGRYQDLVSIYPLSALKRLIPRRSNRLKFSPGLFGANRIDSIEGAISWDLDNYLPDDILRKTDSASMSVALEVRSPFLAPCVAGPATRAMIASLMPRGQRKGLLRQVARKYLPAEIVDRPKQGFAIPIGEWFRTDYGQMRQLLLDHLNSTEPFGPPSLGIELNQKFIKQMIREHMERKRDHSQRLYMLLVLSIWAKWLGSLQRAT